jgi:hypothetical protein
VDEDGEIIEVLARLFDRRFFGEEVVVLVLLGGILLVLVLAA